MNSNGYINCSECKEFVFVTNSESMRELPSDYSGEPCSRCGMWACSLDRIADSEEYPTLEELAASMGTTEADLIEYALWSAGIDVHGLADASD